LRYLTLILTAGVLTGCATDVAMQNPRTGDTAMWRASLLDLSTPPLFMVFDCLQARGKDLRKEALYVRRNVIEDILDEQDMVLPVRRLADHGLKAWQQVLEHGYDGLVAKDPESRYVGGRTLKWLKVKQPHYREASAGGSRRASSRPPVVLLDLSPRRSKSTRIAVRLAHEEEYRPTQHCVSLPLGL